MQLVVEVVRLGGMHEIRPLRGECNQVVARQPLRQARRLATRCGGGLPPARMQRLALRQLVLVDARARQQAKVADALLLRVSSLSAALRLVLPSTGLTTMRTPRKEK